MNNVKLLAERAQKILSSKGRVELFRRCIRFAYNISVRRLFPKIGYRVLNGVRYDKRKFLDSLVPWSYQESDPSYEEALISALREHTREGDRVCVIGGGLGVSTIVAAGVAGPHGSVITYEASAYRIRQIRRVLDLNEHPGTIEVRHALVGPNVRVQGELGSPEPVAPSDLSSCDILEMDCEGAELQILRHVHFADPPRSIIVEVHPGLGASEESVRQELEDRNYEIVNRAAEKEADDVYVLTATRTSATSEV